MKTFLFVTAFLFHVFLCYCPYSEFPEKKEQFHNVNEGYIKVENVQASQSYSELLRNKAKGLSSKDTGHKAR